MGTDVLFTRFFRAARLALLATATALATAATGASAQQTAPAPAQVTFTQDVAQILYRSCVRCHRPDEIAPMSLLTYNDARPWARAIKERVLKREMPPWFLDKTIGIQKYQNDPSLTDEEITTIVKWVDGGALQGNAADMPPMPALEDLSTWRIGKPDLVLKYPTFKVPAHGADLYGTLDAPFGTTEDRYIKAIQSRVVDSTSRKIVHHALSYAVEPGDNSEGGDDSGGGSGLFLVEYASGKNETFYPTDAGLLLHVLSWWDNTTKNRFNPDLKNWVGGGSGRTIDEMGFSWIGWYDLTDEEYKAELPARKAKAGQLLQ